MLLLFSPQFNPYVWLYTAGHASADEGSCQRALFSTAVVVGSARQVMSDNLSGDKNSSSQLQALGSQCAVTTGELIVLLAVADHSRMCGLAGYDGRRGHQEGSVIRRAQPHLQPTACLLLQGKGISYEGSYCIKCYKSHAARVVVWLQGMTEEEATKKGLTFEVYSHTFSPLRAFFSKERVFLMRGLAASNFTGHMRHMWLFACRA
jgi:hypothetical protein